MRRLHLPSRTAVLLTLTGLLLVGCGDDAVEVLRVSEAAEASRVASCLQSHGITEATVRVGSGREQIHTIVVPAPLKPHAQRILRLFGLPETDAARAPITSAGRITPSRMIEHAELIRSHAADCERLIRPLLDGAGLVRIQISASEPSAGSGRVESRSVGVVIRLYPGVRAESVAQRMIGQDGPLESRVAVLISGATGIPAEDVQVVVIHTSADGLPTADELAEARSNGSLDVGRTRVLSLGLIGSCLLTLSFASLYAHGQWRKEP